MQTAAQPALARTHRLVCFFAVTFAAAFAWSAWHPFERGTWWMEVIPGIIGFAVMAATYRRFPLTVVSYVAIWMFALILVTGGHYTYARVPLGDWMRDAFHFSRNHFDRVGHLMQGIVPALVAREVLLRNRQMRRGAWLFYVCVSIALSISAAYELIEWIAGAYSAGGAQDFIGAQGDPWDTQKDMCMALVGSIVAQLLFSRLQDREIRSLAPDLD